MLEFRFAKQEDVQLILDFIKELAEYEKLLHEVDASIESLTEWIFVKEKAEVIFAVIDNKEIGMMLFFHNFSTFRGKSGIYLEDLYIKKEYRGNGYGKKMIEHLAKIAVDRGCPRLEWICLDWNLPSIEFYKKMGAFPLDEWTVFRLTDDELLNAAKTN